MNKVMARAFELARRDGRICKNCGWIITAKSWKNGERDYCAGCKDAMRGVNVRGGCYRDYDDIPDRTGNMP